MGIDANKLHRQSASSLKTLIAKNPHRSAPASRRFGQPLTFSEITAAP